MVRWRGAAGDDMVMTMRMILMMILMMIMLMMMMMSRSAPAGKRGPLQGETAHGPEPKQLAKHRPKQHRAETAQRPAGQARQPSRRARRAQGRNSPPIRGREAR